MDKFDEYASLASVIAQSEVAKVIPPMQAIRRAVQDQDVPGCLAALKQFELAYMDTTLQTLSAFQEATPDAEQVAAGILQARQYHDQYSLEMARLFGLTLTPPTVALTATPAP